MEDKLKFYLDKTIDWGIEFVPKLILAFLIFWIGFKVVKRISKHIDTTILATGISQEIGEFLGNIVEMVMKAAVVLLAISFLGVELSSLVAILGAAAFAIGLSLQGFLGNFASGLTIIFFKPYGIDDWVQIAGTFGKVKSIQIFSTILITPGKKTVIIPNGKVTDDVITNLSTEGIMRLELNVTMPYEEDFNRVKEIISETLKGIDIIVQDPAPVIGIEAYESHNLLLSIRPFIDPNDFWEATYEVHSRIKEAFSKNGIKVAYSEGVELGSIGK